MTYLNRGSKRQASILVVDDERMIAAVLSEILRQQGYEVATAFSGEEAVAKATNFVPDLLVSDICMGAMNGIEAATHITAMHPECRVIFLSGLAAIDDVLCEVPKDLEFSFMSKPMRTLDLLDAIACLLPFAGVVDDGRGMRHLPETYDSMNANQDRVYSQAS